MSAGSRRRRSSTTDSTRRLAASRKKGRMATPAPNLVYVSLKPLTVTSPPQEWTVISPPEEWDEIGYLILELALAFGGKETPYGPLRTPEGKIRTLTDEKRTKTKKILRETTLPIALNKLEAHSKSVLCMSVKEQENCVVIEKIFREIFFEIYLESYGLSPIAVLGDGNCQFRAVAKQLLAKNLATIEDETKLASHLRKLAIEQITTYPDLYRGSIATTRGEHGTIIAQDMTYSNLEEYTREMAKEGTYGDQITLSALSRALNLNILVLSQATQIDPRNLAHNFYHGASGKPITPDNTLILIYEGDYSLHYSAVSNDGKEALYEQLKTLTMPTPPASATMTSIWAGVSAAGAASGVVSSHLPTPK